MDTKKHTIVEKTTIGDNEQDNGVNTLIENFIASMDEKELVAYQIAKEHLESSFDIEKCIGFQSFKKQQ